MATKGTPGPIEGVIPTAALDIATRIKRYDRTAVARDLDANGWAPGPASRRNHPSILAGSNHVFASLFNDIAQCGVERFGR
jgi:hypothetical protein